MSESSSKQSLKNWLRSTFLSGLVVLTPLGLTIYFLNSIIHSADKVLYILPDNLRDQALNFPGSGLVIAFAVVILVGFIARNLFGKFILASINALLERIPLVAALYKLFKQVSDTFLGDGKNKGFRRVVLVEWPRQGTWTLAFVTGDVNKTIQKSMPKPETYLNLFVPATPNPTSGFHFMVAQSECLATPYTVEEAFKILLSAGALGGEKP